MMKLLKFTSVMFTALLLAQITGVAQTAGANNLYSWAHDDGTPTFSPDPPPKGVPYVIVGPDLQPLPDQNASPAAANVAAQPAATPATQANNSGLVLTPAPGDANSAAPATAAAKPKSAWKPVKYADDPNPGANQPVFTARAATPETIVPETTQVSAECLTLKEKLMLLENQFANAVSAAQMDTAVVRLNTFRKQNKGHCGL